MSQRDEREALAEVLRFLSRGHADAYEKADQLLAQFGGVKRLLESEEDVICQNGEMNEIGALLLSSLPALQRRLVQEEYGAHPVLNCFSQLNGYLDSLYLAKHCEEMYVLSLGSRRQLLEATRVREGTLREVQASSRAVMEAVRRVKTETIILCHSHPSGNCHFSMADILWTKELLREMQHLRIAVVDHVLYVNSGRVSMRRNSNWIPEEKWLATGARNIPRGEWLR